MNEKRLDFETPEGRGWLDATIMRLGEAKPGDILVVKYGGMAKRSDAREVVRQIQQVRLPPGSLPKGGLYIIDAPDEMQWEFLTRQVLTADLAKAKRELASLEAQLEAIKDMPVTP